MTVKLRDTLKKKKSNRQKERHDTYSRQRRQTEVAGLKISFEKTKHMTM